MIKYPCQVGSTFTRVWEAGSDGPTALLIHDAGLRLDWWTRNINALAAQGLRVLCFDLPGHGFADKAAAGPHSLEAYTDFVRGLITARRLGRPILVGAGFGGHIAARLACDDPDAVSGLGLCAPTGIVAVGAAARGAYRGMLEDTSESGAAARARLMVADKGLIDPGLIEDELAINRSPRGPESLAALSRYLDRALDTDPLGAQLAGVVARLPVSLTWGAQDEVVPAALARPAAECLGVEAEVWPGCGHAAYFESPDAFNASVVALAARTAR